MMKKALMMVLFLMCFSTIQSAQAACTCGGYVDADIYDGCTNQLISCNSAVEISYGICMDYATEQYEICLEEGYNTDEACLFSYATLKENCDDMYASNLQMCLNQWIYCTNEEACVAP